MSIGWIGTLMCICWVLTLWGGLGFHVIENFNGRTLKAYCRLKRNSERFGSVLDYQQQASTAALYLLLFGLVVGSLAAGAWFVEIGGIENVDGVLVASRDPTTILGWVMGWLFLLTLAGFWLPRVVVRYSCSTFLYHTWPMWLWFSKLISPFVGLGEAFSWLGQRLSDEPEDEGFEEEMLEDEIVTMVAAGQREGVFADGVPEMIEGVMNLDEYDVQEIMTPRSEVDAIDIDLNWEAVVKRVVECGRTRIPVFRGTLDNVIGILFSKDLLSILADRQREPNQQTLESILRKPWFIPGIKPVDELLRTFLHNRNHMAIVLDEYHQFQGVVTIEDALEEIVGEIADELDLEEDSELIYDEANHLIEAQGKVPIESISHFLGVQIPESDDYDTIGGLVVHRLSQIPAVGTTVEVYGMRITVLRATKRLIQRVRLELVDSDNSFNSELN
ncbi:MAG: HlyC/CorC family transporter [Planctomycetales bacterium]|nr:HlyC/CorC family transporter [Planctomycetales bacterium]